MEVSGEGKEGSDSDERTNETVVIRQLFSWICGTIRTIVVADETTWPNGGIVDCTYRA